MTEFPGLTDNPAAFFIIAILAGFAIVAIAKLYGLFFMRWKTPFRVGEAMHVNRAEVVEWEGNEGYVSAGGELWRAKSKDALSPGDKVAVKSVNGLTLSVTRKS